MRFDGKEHEWETWIPKSVIEEGTIAPWFQEKLVERFGHSDRTPVTGSGG